MTSVPTSAQTRAAPYIVYCRFAAVAFLLVALYTTWVKLPSGELATDWVHTLFHVVTDAAAVYLGWFQNDGRGPRVFTWVVVISYGVLGVVGWFVDGLWMGTIFRVPLMAADNAFHLLLSATGLIAIVTARR